MINFKFNLQNHAVTLPDAPTTSTATVGKDYMVYICTGSSYTDPTWTRIGGQRGASLSRSADEIDVSSKTSDGWKSTLAGLKSWSIDLDGLLLLNDEGVDAVESAFNQGKKVFLKFEYPNKRYRTGWAAVTDFSCDTPHDGEASLKGTLSGNGPLSELIPAVTPLTATVSKAAATDQTFTFDPTSTTIASIKNGATALTITTHYTYSAGSLVIKGTYLGGLTVGTIPLTVTTGEGAVMTITVELTA